MTEWQVEVYTSPDGQTPVLAFIQTLPAKVQAKITRDIDLLEEFGNLLGFPHSSYLRDGIRELRIKALGDNIRILYGQRQRTFILLHALLKKTNTIPKSDVELAKRRLPEYGRRSAL